MEPGQGEIAAVLCGDVSDVEVKENGSPLDFVLGLRKDGQVEALPYQDLLFFTPYQPSPTAPYGVSLLHASFPFGSSPDRRPKLYVAGDSGQPFRLWPYRIAL